MKRNVMEGLRRVVIECVIDDINWKCCVGFIYGPSNRLERRQVFDQFKNATTLLEDQ